MLEPSLVVCMLFDSLTCAGCNCVLDLLRMECVMTLGGGAHIRCACAESCCCTTVCTLGCQRTSRLCACQLSPSSIAQAVTSIKVVVVTRIDHTDTSWPPLACHAALVLLPPVASCCPHLQRCTLPSSSLWRATLSSSWPHCSQSLCPPWLPTTPSGRWRTSSTSALCPASKSLGVAAAASAVFNCLFWWRRRQHLLWCFGAVFGVVSIGVVSMCYDRGSGPVLAASAEAGAGAEAGGAGGVVVCAGTQRHAQLFSICALHTMP